MKKAVWAIQTRLRRYTLGHRTQADTENEDDVSSDSNGTDFRAMNILNVIVAVYGCYPRFTLDFR